MRLRAVVSYDLRIFFPHPVFPTEGWRDILASFRGPDCEVQFDEPSADGSSSYLVVGHSRIDADVRPHDGETDGLCAPSSTRWLAGTSTTMGRSYKAYWIQFAIPYHALVFFPGITVHDCQYHVGRSLEASSFVDPGAWLDFARQRLWGPAAGKAELVEQNLFTPEGLPNF